MKVIVLPDMHVPDHDQRSIDNVLEYVQDEKPDNIVLLGDVLSLDCVSKYSSRRSVEERRIRQEIEQGHSLLKDIRSATDAKIYWIEGNHEYRIQKYIDDNPQVEGLIEVPNVIPLEKLGVEWVPFWSDKNNILKIGKAKFIHGLYTNEHHAKTHAVRYGTNVFYGHTHDVQLYSLEQYGHDQTICAMSMGCLCKYDQSYKAGKPDRWQQAFGTFYFKKNGFFNHYVTYVFGHHFIAPNGEEY